MTARVPCDTCGIELLPTAMPGHVRRVHGLTPARVARTDLVYGRQGGRIVPAGPAPATHPLCSVCGQPMAMGQTVRHLTCAALDPHDADTPPTLF